MKKRYEVKGMSCAACVSHVEHAASRVRGVDGVSVSLVTNSITVDITDGYDEQKIYSELKRSLKNAGYSLQSREDGEKRNIADEEFRTGLFRLIFSSVLTVILMVVAMGHMFGIPMPHIFHTHPYLFALLQLILTVPVLIINFRFFKNGFSALWYKGLI